MTHKFAMSSFQLFICFFYYVGFVNQAYSKELVLPYQNCNPSNEEFTQRFISDLSTTSAGFCFNCSIEQSSQNEIIQEMTDMLDTFLIPKQCFLAMALRGNKIFKETQYIICEDKYSSAILDYKNLCVNENYIDMLIDAWRDMSQCFNLSPQRQQEIFHLINHESGGIMNVRSREDARCLGQVTKGYITGINNLIDSRKWTKSDPLPHSEIYDEVIQRCPNLEEKLLTNINFINCQTTHDPYTCLFYSFFDLERYKRRIQDNIKTTADYMGNRTFSDSQKQQFRLPIRLNEMLVVTAQVDGQETDMVFWDDSELYDVLKNSEKQIVILRTKKIPLFKNQTNIELMFNYWSHNGGISLSNLRMIDMVERLKQALSKPCNSNSKTKICELRTQVKNGTGLATEDVLSFFEQDMLDYYPGGQKRKEEVSGYVRKITQTNRQTFGYESGSAQTNEMLNYYKDSVKYKREGIELKHEDALAFQQHISEICPKVNLFNDEPEKEEVFIWTGACLVSDKNNFFNLFD